MWPVDPAVQGQKYQAINKGRASVCWSSCLSPKSDRKDYLSLKNCQRISRTWIRLQAVRIVKQKAEALALKHYSWASSVLKQVLTNDKTKLVNHTSIRTKYIEVQDWKGQSGKKDKLTGRRVIKDLSYGRKPVEPASMLIESLKNRRSSQ